MFSFNSNSPVVLNNFISVKTAVTYTGYSSQYLRRLLRTGRLSGLKIGQVWLIEVNDLEAYLMKVTEMSDHRFGPK